MTAEQKRILLTEIQKLMLQIMLTVGTMQLTMALIGSDMEEWLADQHPFGLFLITMSVAAGWYMAIGWAYQDNNKPEL